MEQLQNNLVQNLKTSLNNIKQKFLARPFWRRIIFIVLIAIAVGVIGTVVWFNMGKNKYIEQTIDQVSKPNTSTEESVPTKTVEKITDPNTPPLKLKTIGINLDYYNPATNHAGDFVFTRAKINLDRLILPFGQVIPGNSMSNYNDKTDPQPEFRLPMGTKVHALVDGVVANVPKLYSDDYSVQISDGVHTNWLYETEHVINPLVKVGDHVTAGQVIAEVSPHSKENYDGLGVVELGILHGGNNGPPHHVCPFAYLDDSIKDVTLAKIKAFFKSWENYIGDQTLYKETTIPGCLTLDPIEG